MTLSLARELEPASFAQSGASAVSIEGLPLAAALAVEQVPLAKPRFLDTIDTERGLSLIMTSKRLTNITPGEILDEEFLNSSDTR